MNDFDTLLEMFTRRSVSYSTGYNFGKNTRELTINNVDNNVADALSVRFIFSGDGDLVNLVAENNE